MTKVTNWWVTRSASLQNIVLGFKQNIRLWHWSVRIIIALLVGPTIAVGVLLVLLAFAMILMPDDGSRLAIKYKPITDFLTSIATPTIAAIVGYVAWRQLRTDEKSFWLETYSRRLAVYKATEEFLREINNSTDGTVSSDTKNRLVDARTESVFIFEGNDISQYLLEIITRKFTLASSHRQLSRLHSTSAVRDDAYETTDELEDFFQRELLNLHDRFKKHMKLR